MKTVLAGSLPLVRLFAAQMPLYRRIRFFVVVLSGLVAFLISYIPNGVFEGLEKTGYDYLQSGIPKIVHETRVLLVDVDEQSLAEVGPWPWPRQITANLISNLTDYYQVAVLGLDMIFPEPRLDDHVLQQALSNPAVILSQTFDFNPDSKNYVGTLIADQILPGLGNTVEAKGFIANHADVIPSNATVGHITPKIDKDGKLRRIQPIICFQGKCTLALSLKLLQTLYQANEVKAVNAWLGSPGYQIFSMSPIVPLDNELAFWVPFRVATGGFEYLSATDVIHRRVPIEKIRNTLVIVGSTALSLGDRVATPEGNQTPGVEIHAQILSALLDGEVITSMDLKGNGFFWVLGVGVIGFCGFLVVFWPKQSSLSVLGFCVALSLFYFLICYWALRQFHALLPITIIPIFLLLSGFFGLLADVVRNNQKLARIAKQSSYFLPSMLVKRLLNDQELSAETESKQLTVLVADMRGFTHASEGKSPAHVAKLAQKCLEVLSEIVVRHGGVIEKYTGDGLMAIWGVGENKVSHAQGALNAGLAMQSEILNLSGWFKNEGFEPMRVSVGINSGDMAVGIYGNAHRAWSAHGDEVNLATRIEQLTRTVGRDLLMGELTAQLVGIDQMECFGLYSVKGREHPVRVYGLKIQDVRIEK